MSTDAVAILGFVALFALMLLRVPVGMAMGLVGVSGFGYLVGGTPALKLVGQTSMRTVTDYTFGVIPMFLLMGTFMSNSGMSRDLFKAANGFVGHLRGGLGFATVVACGGFAAICGSSVATAATFSAVAYPEMRRYGYPQSFATGVIAAGGTLGAMLPPSIVLAVYGIITEQDIGKLFIAGIVPGLLAMAMYLSTIFVIGRVRPGFLPAGPRIAWRAAAYRPERHLAAVAAVRFRHRRTLRPAVPAALHADRSRRRRRHRRLPDRRSLTGRLNKDKILASLLQATRTAAAVFTVLIGALIFGYFLTVTQTPQKVTEFLTGLGPRPLRRAGADHADVSGARLPDGRHGHDHPDRADHFPGRHPSRLQPDLVRHHHRDDGGARAYPSAGRHERLRHQERGEGRQSFATIFKGVMPFIVTDLIRLVILIAFPIIALWLPSHM